jgi:hypothetical protein
MIGLLVVARDVLNLMNFVVFEGVHYY